MKSLCVLPSEVICHVICFLNPGDLIRLRLVSLLSFDGQLVLQSGHDGAGFQAAP